MDQQFLKAEEIARILGLSRSYVYRLLQHGDLPAIRIGRTVRVRRVDLEKFIIGSETCRKNYATQETAVPNK